MGGDFLDGTPVLDIKPYIPYADSVNTLTAGYAIDKPEVKFSVLFSEQVKNELKMAEIQYPALGQIITEILQLDPRPAYQNEKQSKMNLQ